MYLVLTKGSQRDKDEQQRFLSTSPKSFRIKGVKDKGGTGCHIFASTVVGGWRQDWTPCCSSQWVLKGSSGQTGRDLYISAASLYSVYPQTGAHYYLKSKVT